ncbi:hypothetical protein ACP4OV_002704 [Aristida adscensionis]
MAASDRQEAPMHQAPAILDHMPAILGHLKDHQVVVVSAEPGSGKSSVLPRCLASAGYGPVICAQPRHLAATVASAKAAGEATETGAVFTTTRVLADVLRDPPAVAAAFRAVVVDEAHDRTLCADAVLAMVRAALASGAMGGCRVVVCAAGGPAGGVLGDFFSGAPVLAFRRPASPVHVHYSAGPVIDMVGAVVDEEAAIHRSRPPGDVLAFLPEVVDVEEACHRLRRLGLPGLLACVVHDHLPAELIGVALDPAPAGARKVVLATDVAETAVPVPGITYVVDSGVLSEAEPVEMISKEAAERRRRAAANGAGTGHCHRLYTQAEHAGLDEHAVPFIRRDGAHLMFALILRRHGADGMPGFEFLEPSVKLALESVVTELVAAGFLDQHGKLTEKGEREAYDED